MGRAAQLAELRSADRQRCSARNAGAHRRCRCCSRTRSRRDYVPGFRSAAAAPATPASTRPTAARSPTRTSPTTCSPTSPKVWGSHTTKAGIYYQNSYKPQSIFASFNGQINFTDDAQQPVRHRATATRTRRRASSTPTRRPTSSRCPEWSYKNFEWYAQDNWKASRKLTLDYGVRFYYLTPQWDTSLQASNFLPDQFNSAERREALQAGLHRRVPVLRREPARHGSDARRRAQRRRSPTRSRAASSAA